MYVFTKEIVGTVAMWAVRQSPYIVPENLVQVLLALERSVKEDADKFQMIKFEDGRALERYLSEKLQAIPEYMAWNVRKNGNASPLHFTSRFDLPGDPNDDFIDLGALERNVAMSVSREARECEGSDAAAFVLTATERNS